MIPLGETEFFMHEKKMKKSKQDGMNVINRHFDFIINRFHFGGFASTKIHCFGGFIKFRVPPRNIQFSLWDTAWAFSHRNVAIYTSESKSPPTRTSFCCFACHFSLIWLSQSLHFFGSVTKSVTKRLAKNNIKIVHWVRHRFENAFVQPT